MNKGGVTTLGTCYNLSMAELKTKKNSASVTAFIKAVGDAHRRADDLQLLGIFHKATGMKPAMWGTSIVGYGSYHYKSERSRQEGDWPLTGFSPRVQNLTIYIMPGFKEYAPLLKKLGKHTTSKACLYIKRLSDVDIKVLEKLIDVAFRQAKKKLT